MEDVTNVVGLDIISMSAQNIIDKKIIKYSRHTKPRKTKNKKSTIRPRKSSYKCKNRNQQLNFMESTNSYAASTFCKETQSDWDTYTRLHRLKIRITRLEKFLL